MNPSLLLNIETKNLDRDKILKRLEKLRRIIKKAEFSYYVLDKQLLSDSKYDLLYQELLELEEEYPEFFDPSSPTQNVNVWYGKGN